MRNVSAVKARKGGMTLGKALSLSVLNQAVSSGTNFALGIYLVRVLPPVEFGLYGIGFAICLFYSGIGNALFLTQMVVHTPDRSQEDRLPYATRIFVALVLFCVLTIVAAGLLFALIQLLPDSLVQFAGLGLAVTGASVSYLLKDFFIRHAYTARKETCALAINIAAAIGLLGSLLLKHQTDTGLSSETALWMYALGNLTGAVAGLVLVRLPLTAVQFFRVAKDVREAWIGGRWAIGGVSVIWAQSQAYMYVTALFAGPAGVGYANAAKLLITPVISLVPAISQIAMPRLAEMRATNPPAMLRAGGLFTFGMVILGAIYSVALLGLLDEIAPLLLGAGYEDIAALVAAWCLVMLFQLARSGTVTVLQVLKHFRRITLVNLVSAAITVLACLILIRSLGVQGAILGVGFGELIFSVWLWRLLPRRDIRAGSTVNDDLGKRRL